MTLTHPTPIRGGKRDERSVEVVTLGEALIALQPEPSGSLRDTDLLRRHVGGAELNVAVGLARLNHRAAWTGWVGDDEFGRIVLDVLRKEAVDVSRARVVPGAWTGVYFREIRPRDRLRVHYYRSGSAACRMDPSALDVDFHVSGGILHLTGITAALSDTAARVVTELAGEARRRGVTVSFDANLRWRMLGQRDPARLLSEALDQADVIFLSDEEADALIGGHEVRDAQRFLERKGEGQLVVHAASHAFAVDGAGVNELAVERATVVDPVGAGDAFVAGFLAGRLRGLPSQDCLRMANGAGACAVSTRGDAESMPREEDLQALLQGTAGVER
jgi:2-dehydro-3-deoxygluconokinase